MEDRMRLHKLSRGMSHHTSRALLLLALPLAASWSACGGAPPPAEAPSAPETAAPEAAAPAADAKSDLDPELGKKLVTEEGAVLIDVRDDEEFGDRHLEGAKHVPVDQVESRVEEIKEMVGGDMSEPVVLYCRSGGRAGRAKKMLEEAGFTKVVNAGGIDDWPE